MRIALASLAGLAAAVVTMVPAAYAQPLPPGDYPARCRDIAMNGLFLSATCAGARGGGQSSINVESCPGRNITVDATGALACAGVIGGRPQPGPAYPGGPGYFPDRPGRPPVVVGPPPAYGRDAIVVYSRRGFDGRSAQFDGPVSNLETTGLNDRVRSIRLGRRSGPWLVCSDANFRGRCERIDGDLADTRRIGMDRAISSLRPLR